MSKLWFYHWCWWWWWCCCCCWWWCCWWWWWWWWRRLALLYPQKKKHRAEKKQNKTSALSLRSTSTRPWTFGGSFAVHPTPACLACSLVASEVKTADVEKQFGGQLHLRQSSNHIDMRFLTSFFVASSWDEDDFHGASVVPRFGRRFRWLIIQPFQFFHVESTRWIHPVSLRGIPAWSDLCFTNRTQVQLILSFLDAKSLGRCESAWPSFLAAAETSEVGKPWGWQEESQGPSMENSPGCLEFIIGD